jgi:energy-converting hydrogenase Eha subunit G
MASTDPHRPRRRADSIAAREFAVARREQCVEAREREWRGRRSLRCLWWALRLLPGAALELAAGAWLVASVVLLSGPALVVDVGATGLLVACVGLARLLDRSPPSGSDPPRTV